MIPAFTLTHLRDAAGQRRWVSLLPLACALVLTGCDSPRSAPAEAHYDLDVPQGEPQGPHYEDADLDLLAGPPERCPTTGVLAPQTGYTRWAIPVSVATRSQRHVPVGPMLFSLLIDGQLHRPTLASCKAPFAARQLKPEERVQAHVVFDLPSVTPPLKLIYEPFIVGRQPVRAQVIVPALP